MVKIIEDFNEVIPNYELFIVDIFGVIHDGLELYPKVFENIQQIKKQNKHFVFLSNAPRRATKAQTALHNFGITKDLYDFIITSGEHAFTYFKNQPILKYFYLGPDKDRDLLDGTEHKMVDNPEEADIAITTGLDPDQQVSDIMTEINSIKNANLELHCINPDKFVHKQSGASHVCAGAIADKYIEMGGKVEYYGKPYLSIYESILSKFTNTPKDKILCIGDGLETDIKGANSAGLSSVLITSGMHVNELKTSIGTLHEINNVETLTKKYQSSPTYISPLF